MKKLINPYLIIITAFTGSLLMLTGCGDKDDEPGFVAAELVGTWTYSSFDFSATINGQDFLEFFSDLYGTPANQLEDLEDEWAGLFNEFDGLSVTFNADGTYLAKAPGEPDATGTWSLNEDDQVLTITIDGESIAYEISVLNASSLVFGFSETLDSFDFDDDGTNDEFIFELTIGLTK